jgi:hypothetical protein
LPAKKYLSAGIGAVGDVGNGVESGLPAGEVAGHGGLVVRPAATSPKLTLAGALSGSPHLSPFGQCSF